MEFEKLKYEGNKNSLEEALRQVKMNSQASYIWVAFKNKKGILIECAGRFHNNKLEFKFSIPAFDQGKYVVHPNGYTKTLVDFDNEGGKIYSKKNMTHKMNEEKLIKFIDNTDFKEWVDKDYDDTEYCQCCGQKINH